MRTLSVLALLFSTLAFASPSNDPRNTREYQVLFDLEASGKTDLVHGYGGYVQVYSPNDTLTRVGQLIRYCANFDGKGLSGRPNPGRERMKLVPFGTADDTAYRCRDITPTEFAGGVNLIELGNRSFFAMKSTNWSTHSGGEILFQFPKKLPLLGSADFLSLRIRALRFGSDLNYVVETVIPKTGVVPSHYFLFDVSGSGLGLPNGIAGLEINPGDSTARKIDLDGLEGKIDIQGFSSGAPAKKR